MLQIIKKEVEYAGKKLTLETGEFSLRSNIAVKASYGETVLLVNIVYNKPKETTDFLDLRIEYQEKFYASGLINNNRFLKREGKPSDDSIVTRRLIDHAFRPIFMPELNLSVQISITVLSLDPNADAELLAMIATSSALHASKLPVAGPVITGRVGLVNGNFLLSPSKEVLSTTSDIDMMVSFVGKDKKFLAVEAGVNLLPEQKVLEAINFVRDNSDSLLSLISDFRDAVNKTNEKIILEEKNEPLDLYNLLVNNFEQKICNAIYGQFEDKKTILDQLKEQAIEMYKNDFNTEDIVKIVNNFEKMYIRKLVLDKKQRLDGRGLDQVRQISCKTQILPRTHGSGLFTRGNTQALTIATLGSPSCEMLQFDMYGESTKRFMHFYNFPPFSTGEIGRYGSPGGREIGHGMIAEKALKPLIPSKQDFPYTIHLTSEILSSNGSSSMAATCGSTLALLSAGVPIKDMVGGIAMGLIVSNPNDFTDYQVITDLSGEEDFAGYLDFKMTGTRDGVTAIQCDMKLQGIPMNILEEVMSKSKIARIYVIDQMSLVIDKPNPSLSIYAPKLLNINISPEKIGTVIGSGGKTIKQIQEETNTEVHIEDDGKVTVSGDNIENVQKAINWIDGLTKEIEVGEVFKGLVVDVLDFGALVQILPSKVGLLHVSEFSNEYIKDIKSVVKIGDSFDVKVLKVEANGKISLSKKVLLKNS